MGSSGGRWRDRPSFDGFAGLRGRYRSLQIADVNGVIRPMNKRAAVAALLVLGCGAGSNGASEVGPTDASPSRDGSGADASLPPPPPDDAGVRGRSSIGGALV